jgi:monomeric sarcosine oxidase
MSTGKSFDVAVVGAGVFGAWTAFELQRLGQRVLLVDAFGSSNSRASSGGESRIIRMGYGPDEIYTRWSNRALERWKEFFTLTDDRLFHETGVLWLAADHDPYVSQSEAIMRKVGVNLEKLSKQDLKKRYPQIGLEGIGWGLLEPSSGVLMARRAVQFVVRRAMESGVAFLQGKVEAPVGKGRVNDLQTEDGGSVKAGTFVFACGPWLPKIFPDLLGHRIFPTRQAVMFWGTPPGDPQFKSPSMSTWICMHSDEYYGMPDLEGRGFKIALDRHGTPFDPDYGERFVTEAEVSIVRKYLAKRFPALQNAPLTESRVCQYENTSNGDFLVDRHPDYTNVWLVGGGSGHGFKHGPSLGEYTAFQILGRGVSEPRFSLASKMTTKHRQVY